MNSLERLQFMLSFAVQACLLTGVAIAIERRCSSASVKTRIWTVFYLCLLAILLAGLVLPRLQWANPWRRLPASDLGMVIRTQQMLSGALLTLWLGGVGYKLVQWLISFVRLRRFMQACPVVETRQRTRLLALVSSDLTDSLAAEVELRIGPEQLGPSCYQLHRPVILLPPSLVAGSDVELRYVLQHELEHLRTQHPLQAFGQRLAETLLWFLPPIRHAGRRAGLAREFVCDDAATARDASAARYLTTLLRFAQQTPRCPNAMMGLSPTMSDLRLRAERLAARSSATPARGWSLAPATLVLCALAISQCWLPTYPLASAAVAYSPWPAWSAAALYAFDIPVRDFDEFDPQLQVFDLLHDDEQGVSTANR